MFKNKKTIFKEFNSNDPSDFGIAKYYEQKCEILEQSNFKYITKITDIKTQVNIALDYIQKWLNYEIKDNDIDGMHKVMAILERIK